jgi:hypothetical protein
MPIPDQSALFVGCLRLLNILNVCLGRLNPRRLAGSFDLKPEEAGIISTKTLTCRGMVCYSRHHDYFRKQHSSTSYQRSGVLRRLTARAC